MSQPVFARLLGAGKSAVAQWERGAKRPSGPTARLPEEACRRTCACISTPRPSPGAA